MPHAVLRKLALATSREKSISRLLKLQETMLIGRHSFHSRLAGEPRGISRRVIPFTNPPHSLVMTIRAPGQTHFRSRGPTAGVFRLTNEPAWGMPDMTAPQSRLRLAFPTWQQKATHHKRYAREGRMKGASSTRLRSQTSCKDRRQPDYRQKAEQRPVRLTPPECRELETNSSDEVEVRKERL